jgi:hypothetical protein
MKVLSLSGRVVGKLRPVYIYKKITEFLGILLDITKVEMKGSVDANFQWNVYKFIRPNHLLDLTT